MSRFQIKSNFLKVVAKSLNIFEQFQVSCRPSALKELRSRILRTTLEWLLFCLIRHYVGLHFSMSSFRKLVFRLSVLSFNQDMKICVIMLPNFEFVLTLGKNSPFCK